MRGTYAWQSITEGPQIRGTGRALARWAAETGTGLNSGMKRGLFSGRVSDQSERSTGSLKGIRVRKITKAVWDKTAKSNQILELNQGELKKA